MRNKPLFYWKDGGVFLNHNTFKQELRAAIKRQMLGTPRKRR